MKSTILVIGLLLTPFFVFGNDPIAMAIGQGAGTLAGLAAVKNTIPGKVDYVELAKTLKENGA